MYADSMYFGPEVSNINYFKAKVLLFGCMDSEGADTIIYPQRCLKPVLTVQASILHELHGQSLEH